MRRLALVLVTLTLASLTWAAPPDIPQQPLISQLHEQEAAARKPPPDRDRPMRPRGRSRSVRGGVALSMPALMVPRTPRPVETFLSDADPTTSLREREWRGTGLR